MKILSSISTLLIFTSDFISKADAHGYVMTPRSRQWVAAEVSYL